MHVEEREGRVLTFSRNLAPFEKLVAKSDTRRLLDLGCHIGVMVELAQARGWDAWGVEPSTWASEQARARGLHVVTGTLSDAKVPENYFDVVTLWDVVEHLTDPAAELRMVHRVLKPGGVFAIHTIDIESMFARLMGRRWPWLMEMHFGPLFAADAGQNAGANWIEVISSSAQGRFLRLGYFVTRLQPYSESIYKLLNGIVTRMKWEGIAIP